MICPKCGKDNSNNAAFCSECGADLNIVDTSDSQANDAFSTSYSEQYNNSQNQGYNSGSQYSQNQDYNNGSQYSQNQGYQNYNQPYQNNGQGYPNNYGSNYNNGGYSEQNDRPISAWGYIGYMFLFSIPCLGLIMLFVYGFGSKTNINLKNFARAYLILAAITIILYVIFFCIMLAAGADMSEFANRSRYYG